MTDMRETLEQLIAQGNIAREKLKGDKNGSYSPAQEELTELREAIVARGMKAKEQLEALLEQTSPSQDLPDVAESMPTVRLSEVSGEAIERMTCYMRAHNEELRLRILLTLQWRTGMTVQEMVQDLQATQTAISHHLGILRNMGYVEYERVGRNNHYQITERYTEGFAAMMAFVTNCSSSSLRRDV